MIAPRSSSGRWVVVPRSYEQVKLASFRRGQRRRRRILVWLAAMCAVSLAGAVLTGAGWGVHLALDASLIAYVMLLLEAKKRRLERRHKVKRLPRRPAVAWRGYEPAEAVGGRRS